MAKKIKEGRFGFGLGPLGLESTSPREGHLRPETGRTAANMLHQTRKTRPPFCDSHLAGGRRQPPPPELRGSRGASTAVTSAAARRRPKVSFCPRRTGRQPASTISNPSSCANGQSWTFSSSSSSSSFFFWWGLFCFRFSPRRPL